MVNLFCQEIIAIQKSGFKDFVDYLTSENFFYKILLTVLNTFHGNYTFYKRLRLGKPQMVSSHTY